MSKAHSYYLNQRVVSKTGRRFFMAVALAIISVSLLAFGANANKTQHAQLIVPDQYSTIQEAIDNANDGETVFVRSGTYYEHVVVNRTISLVGENKDTTIIDGSRIGIVINVSQNDVHMSGFTIRNSGTIWNIGGPPYGAGIYMRNVTNCSICENRFIQDAAGVQLENGADRNVIANNTMTNVGLGLGTFDASWNRFVGNNVTSYGRGLGLNVNSDCNIISDNVVSARELTIALHMCHYNNITRNYVANGQIGIHLPDSSYNRVYRNNIVSNAQQASFQGFPSHPNYWDDDYQSCGNYWSDYNGTDVFRGFWQNETGSDGVGDTPYVIDGNNTDHYPLMKLYGSAASVSIAPISTAVFLGESVRFTSTASVGTPPCSYQWYLNGTPVPGANSNSWIFASEQKGSYAVCLNVTDSLGNTVKSNQASVTFVHLVGDLNRDGIVNMTDMGVGAAAFGTSLSDPRWNLLADINHDGKVDMMDLGTMARHFGEHYP